MDCLGWKPNCTGLILSARYYSNVVGIIHSYSFESEDSSANGL